MFRIIPAPLYDVLLSDNERINFYAYTKHSKTYVLMTYQVTGDELWEERPFPKNIKVYLDHDREYPIRFASDAIENSEDDFFSFLAFEDFIYCIYRDDKFVCDIKVRIPEPYVLPAQNN